MENEDSLLPVYGFVHTIALRYREPKQCLFSTDYPVSPRGLLHKWFRRLESTQCCFKVSFSVLGSAALHPGKPAALSHKEIFTEYEEIQEKISHRCIPWWMGRAQYQSIVDNCVCSPDTRSPPCAARNVHHPETPKNRLHKNVIQNRLPSRPRLCTKERMCGISSGFDEKNAER